MWNNFLHNCLHILQCCICIFVPYGLWPEIKFYYYYYYKTVKINTPKTNGKTRVKTGKMDWGATIGDIVRQVVLATQPPLIKVVTSTVTTATRQLMTEMACETEVRVGRVEEGGPAPYIRVGPPWAVQPSWVHQDLRHWWDGRRGHGQLSTGAGGGHWHDVAAGRHQRQPQTAGTIRQHATHHREVCAEEYKDGDDEEQAKVTWRQQDRCLHKRRTDSSACEGGTDSTTRSFDTQRRRLYHIDLRATLTVPTIAEIYRLQLSVWLPYNGKT